MTTTNTTSNWLIDTFYPNAGQEEREDARKVNDQIYGRLPRLAYQLEYATLDEPSTLWIVTGLKDAMVKFRHLVSSPATVKARVFGVIPPTLDRVTYTPGSNNPEGKIVEIASYARDVSAPWLNS